MNDCKIENEIKCDFDLNLPWFEPGLNKLRLASQLWLSINARGEFLNTTIY
jgi:hypothetical protein